jgi:phosphoribosylformylglycinamidine synthase
VGGRLPGPEAAEPAFWSVNDNFCLPNVVYDETANPDGRQKLGKLVRMCEALYDMAVAYSIPLTSGKDSMKNDLRAGGETISIPPTVLYSMAAGIPDVRRCVTSDLKAAGDALYVVGSTADELGGSEFYRLLGSLGRNVPRVDPEAARARYRRLGDAMAADCVASCHDISDGGFAVALVESAFGGDLGFDIDVAAMGHVERPHVALFSETASRFVVSVPAGEEAAFESALGGDTVFLGRVTKAGRARIFMGGRGLVDVGLAQLADEWSRALEAFV